MTAAALLLASHLEEHWPAIATFFAERNWPDTKLGNAAACLNADMSQIIAALRTKTTPISENDRRWRFLEHGCQWVSFTPTGGETKAFDPRYVSEYGLLGLRKYVDAEAAKQLKLLQAGAEQLAKSSR